MTERGQALLVSLQQASALLGLSPTSIRDLVRRGELCAVFPPASPTSRRRRWWFRRSDLLAAVEKWTVTPRPLGGRR
jgi:hypothetical protein